ncbi:MAG TPA: hypothetical protein VG942_10790 [Hyphomonadaceae bacterium]|nr:hypothetical protein [Hyphomonadaceae bacterium]
MNLKSLAYTVPAIALSFCANSSPAWAQAPADLHKRLSDLKQIEIGAGLTRIRNAEGDGRDAQIFYALRDDVSAWGFGVYIVTMPTRVWPDKPAWNIVGIETDDHDLDVQIADQPHTRDDDLKAVRFARGKLDGVTDTFLITATRDPDSPVADAASTAIRIYSLGNHEDEGFGTTPDRFDLVFSYTTARKYSDADDALLDELKLPLPPD